MSVPKAIISNQVSSLILKSSLKKYSTLSLIILILFSCRKVIALGQALSVKFVTPQPALVIKKSLGIVLITLLIANSISCSKEEDAAPNGSETITTTPVTDISATEATSGGNITLAKGKTVTERILAWQNTPFKDFSMTWTKVPPPTTGSFSSRITGLRPNTTYYVRAFASIDAGYQNQYSIRGNQVSFRTLSDIPEIIQATFNEAYLEYQFGTDKEHGLCWSTSQNPTITDSKLSTNLDSLVAHLTNLSPNTTYYVRAYEIPEPGQISYGNETNFKTPIPLYSEAGTIQDIDGNTYRTIQIGSQTWMAENLRTSKYANGDAIPEFTGVSNTEWFSKRTGAWRQPETYNGFAVTDVRKLCPSGWHVPSDPEWTVLTDYLGGEKLAGGKMKIFGLEYWRYPNRAASNESGFSALPVPSIIYIGFGGGFSGPSGGRSSGLNNELGVGTWYATEFWSSTQHEPDPDTNAASLSYRGLDYSDGKINMWWPLPQNRGLCVRCIKD